MFSSFLEFGYTMVEGLWGTRALPRATARAALEELVARGFLRKEAVRTGRRGRPPVRYHLIGHPDEAEERFNTMMKQRRQHGTSEADEFAYDTRARPLKKSTPEVHLGLALDIACANTGTIGAFDTHPRCPRKYGKPDYGSKQLKMVLFADGSMWHGGQQYERQKDTVNEKIRNRIERQKERDREVNAEWEALGWRVVRYWEEELRDWRSVADRLSEEIWDAVDRLREEQKDSVAQTTTGS